ncbi:MAG: hypothetical protein H6983_10985 [Ectothiorhodospiraceae bacterium]|nr:hypothetical protein [Chromatiales bacterium]MCP5154683.1 hypothetical protein [Ectothiorhodospiraceae bacterium]
MPRRARSARFALGVCLVAAIAAGGPLVAAEERGLRDAMQLIFERMRELVSLAAVPERFGASDNATTVIEALREIGDQAAMVSEHAGTDVGSGFLASSLDRYTGWALRNYEWGQIPAARSLVLEAVEVCIACHTRLPSGDSPVAEDFVASDTLARMAPRERARLLAATRRFDDAMTTLESELTAPSTSPASRVELMREYLLVAVRVRGELGRAASTLRAARDAGELPEASRTAVSAWVADLDEIGRHPIPEDDVLYSRWLLQGSAADPLSDDHSDLVRALAASAVLNRFLEREKPDGERLAEAYLLLGLAEARIDEPAGLPEAELYLESAILGAPGTPIAKVAFALLSKKVRRGFESGPEGKMPEEVMRHLAALEARSRGE